MRVLVSSVELYQQPYRKTTSQQGERAIRAGLGASMLRLDHDTSRAASPCGRATGGEHGRAGVLLTRAKDPLVATLEAAPFDDEPYTGEDRAASDDGWAAYRRDEAINVAELRAEPEADA